MSKVLYWSTVPEKLCGAGGVSVNQGVNKINNFFWEVE